MYFVYAWIISFRYLYLLATYVFFWGVFLQYITNTFANSHDYLLIYLFICLQLFCTHYVTLNVENVLTVSLQGLSTLVVKEVFHYMLKHSNSKSIPIPKLNNPITIWDIT